MYMLKGAEKKKLRSNRTGDSTSISFPIHLHHKAFCKKKKKKTKEKKEERRKKEVRMIGITSGNLIGAW